MEKDVGITVSNEKHVDLWDSHDPFLVVEEKTGITYSQQVGGIMCDHPNVEGFLVPLGDEVHWRAIGQASHEFCCSGALTPEFAEKAQELWPKPSSSYAMGWIIALDETRLSEGTECYIPVVAKQVKKIDWDTSQPKEEAKISWTPLRKGWLLLPWNCD